MGSVELITNAYDGNDPYLSVCSFIDVHCTICHLPGSEFIFTARRRNCWNVMFSQASVSHSGHRVSVFLVPGPFLRVSLVSGPFRGWWYVQGVIMLRVGMSRG